MAYFPTTDSTWKKKKFENFMSLDALLNESEYADRTMELNKIVFAFQYL